MWTNSYKSLFKSSEPRKHVYCFKVNFEISKLVYVSSLVGIYYHMLNSILFWYTDDIKPSVMIVEEAAEILEGQLVAVIPPSVKHLIMIGDHKQLKPIVHFIRLKKRHHLDVSMFERLVNCKLPFIQLRYQCRMRDEFVDLLRELKLYEELKTNEEVIKQCDIQR